MACGEAPSARLFGQTRRNTAAHQRDQAAKGGTMSAPMKFPRRKFLQLAESTAALPALSGFAWAQIDLSRTIRLVVPFPPGGSVDQISRMVQAGLQQRLGATV